MAEPANELWVTRLFNDYLGGVGKSILQMVGVQAEHPDRPWADFVTMEIVAALALVALALVLRSRLSMDRPGKLQHTIEVVYLFLKGQAQESIGHHYEKYVSFASTIFFFVLFANLLGVIPTFSSPTMTPYVPAGCAVATFLYYHAMGIRSLGLFKYLGHFLGPVLWMAPLMLPIEVISHCSRMLSLTVRLYGNMYAGDQVTEVFLGLTYLIVPAMFMGLHVFVSFLQAYVFGLLTMIYTGMGVAHEH
jgi:F-type H+-transporting ATPase subunit a